MLRRFCQAETGFFLVIWLLLLVAGRSSLLRDPGTFWHTATGERVLYSGELIRTDPFSFTFGGQIWTPYGWLGEILMAIIHRSTGFDGLVLATATILAALFAWIAGRLVRSGLHWLPTTLLLALAIAASSYHFHARTHLATLAFLSWTYARLVDFEAGRIRFRNLLWLVPAYVLWANVHGGVLAGIGLVGLSVGSWMVLWLLGKTGPVTGRKDMARLCGLLVVLLGTIVVSPYGLELPRAWWIVLTADLPKIIEEHAPLDALEPSGALVLLCGAVYAFVLLGTLGRWPRVTWLLPAVLLYLAVTRIRHGPLFALAASLAMADMLPHTYWSGWLMRRGSDLFQPPVAAENTRVRWADGAIPALALLLSFFLQLGQVSVPVIGHGWAKLDPERWPVELLPTLREHEKESTLIFNELLYGGFLIHQTPGYRIFVDDRAELYGKQFLQAYDRAAREKPDQIDSWQQQYGFRLALVRTGSQFDSYLSKSNRWRAVAISTTATLYELW